ncbi:uncharacterized protein LOC132063074 [Lycium ferocissimum]|uniref:uncharacterized protein LOC132063074 n=1 Tax=Lycium ferocissimum TaxID=112874 RepID=UPI002814D7FB|nr:uncharacterized protein LOC132063074 [Lycium ferocissimum]
MPPSYSNALTDDDREDTYSYEQNDNRELIMLIENEDLQWRDAPLQIMQIYFDVGSYAAITYKYYMNYEPDFSRDYLTTTNTYDFSRISGPNINKLALSIGFHRFYRTLPYSATNQKPFSSGSSTLVSALRCNISLFLDICNISLCDLFRVDILQGILDILRRGEREASHIGKQQILPLSLTGGPRDMRRRYMDAIVLVQHFGKPDIFFTMTCNPSWPEIKANLLSTDELQNRPDLVSRVFRANLEELKKDILKRHIFGKVAAYMYMVEFETTCSFSYYT